VRLNRAIAVAELDGPQGLSEVDGLPLEGYHAFHATRADLLRRLGRSESRTAYDRAIGLAGNTAEKAYLIRRRDQLAGP
jgi:RNA polymerase sigma-70 factor (ECF subfamily)